MTDPARSDPVPPESGESAPAELFMHALLDFRRLDTPVIQDLRIRLAMQAIAAEPSIASTQSRFRLPRIILSAAASLALLAGGVYYFTSTEPKAMALVEASLSVAAKTADVRRYEVRTSADPASPSRLEATLDVGSDRRFVFRASAPDGARIAGGRGEAEWALTPDMSIDRAAARTRWPRWIFLLDESITGSPDDILDRVRRDYEPQLDDVATINGVDCRHIRATLRPQPRTLPLPPSGRQSRPEAPAEKVPRSRKGDFAGLEADPPHRRLDGLSGTDGGRNDRGPDYFPMGPKTPGSNALPRRAGPFIPPDVVPTGPMRSRLPASIDLWIDQESFVLRKMVVRWEGPRPAPPQRPGQPPHPRPPSRLEFLLVETDAPPETDAWFEPESHLGPA